MDLDSEPNEPNLTTVSKDEGWNQIDLFLARHLIEIGWTTA